MQDFLLISVRFIIILVKGKSNWKLLCFKINKGCPYEKHGDFICSTSIKNTEKIEKYKSYEGFQKIV